MPSKKSKSVKPPKTAAVKKSKRRMLFIDVGVGLAAVVLTAAGLWFNTIRQPEGRDVACDKPGVSHPVELKGDQFSPGELEIKRCDRIIIANRGDQEYELAFGSHQNLTSYPGFSQQFLSPGEYFELDAIQGGSYTLHDHIGNKAYLKISIRD